MTATKTFHEIRGKRLGAEPIVPFRVLEALETKWLTAVAKKTRTARRGCAISSQRRAPTPRSRADVKTGLIDEKMATLDQKSVTNSPEICANGMIEMSHLIAAVCVRREA